jgi:hypothetical protein
MLTGFESAIRSFVAPTRRAARDEDYRVKLYKAASRSGHDAVERANAALAERIAEDRERARTTREALLRERVRR